MADEKYKYVKISYIRDLRKLLKIASSKGRLVKDPLTSETTYTYEVMKKDLTFEDKDFLKKLSLKMDLLVELNYWTRLEVPNPYFNIDDRMYSIILSSISKFCYKAASKRWTYDTKAVLPFIYLQILMVYQPGWPMLQSKGMITRKRLDEYESTNNYDFAF